MPHPPPEAHEAPAPPEAVEPVEYHEPVSPGALRMGRLAHLQTRWVRHAPLLVPVALALAVLFGLLARIDVYEAGPAVVRLDRRTEVTARATGLLARIEVKPGQKVKAGTVLATFSPQAETHELKARVDEWENELRRYLTNPGSKDSYQALVSLESSRRLAEHRLVELVVRAPHDGVVADVHARTGQWLSAGDLICSLVAHASGATVEAYLPGRARPTLIPGAPLLVELEGERYRYFHLTITAVDEEVVGPAEVKRALGPAYGNLMKVSGLVVRVHARATGTGDASMLIHDGATGTATARLERLSLWAVLLRTMRELGG